MKNLLCICLLLVLTSSSTAWQNDWDAPLNWACPGGQAVYRVVSQYDNGKHDRQFEMQCSDFPGTFGSCYETPFVNWWDAIMVASCYESGVIIGASSVHDDTKEDRRWTYHCCLGDDYYLYDCHYDNSVHDYHGWHDYSAPAGYWIHGVTSNHDDNQEDRLWQYKICKIGFY
ncbi:dermatopontin-like [Antedon mediterranea]|uniref:dermatopontin-like n=1 Tax=Antedon mediterranea TaxID=105859 RepID=UPI003AF81D60